MQGLKTTYQPLAGQTTTVIQVEHLTKYYGDFIAIEDVSFEVKRGEIVGFLGPNAAGKTTTMRILSGFLPPTEGTAIIAGFDILKNSLEARRQIGYLPENVPLYTDMPVRSYLDYQARLHGMESQARKSRTDFVIERLRLQDYTETLIGRLSKGFRQRVGVAQAILHDPQVLILDEPTNGIDPVQVVETRELVRGLGQDHTVVFSSHILSEVSAISTRIVVINEGRVVAEDRPEHLSVRLRGTEQIQMQIRGPGRNIAARLRQVDGVQDVTRKEVDGNVFLYTLECSPGLNLSEQLANLVVRQGWGLLGLQAVTMSLEDIFLQLTQREEQGASS